MTISNESDAAFADVVVRKFTNAQTISYAQLAAQCGGLSCCVGRIQREEFAQ